MESANPDRMTFESRSESIAFIDLAGFSAIADVFGDQTAIEILEVFEGLVEKHGGEGGRLVKWIGDEAMLAFPDPFTALLMMGGLLRDCRADERIPLTRSAIHHGPVISRNGDLFGSTVNIAARIAAIAKAGEILVTAPVAEAAREQGVDTRALGPVALRSIVEPVPLFLIRLAETVDPEWIDPVCKMHAPFATYQREKPTGPWFCSEKCEEAYRRSPTSYII